jgi:hypothetical protein
MSTRVNNVAGRYAFHAAPPSSAGAVTGRI